MTKSEILDAIRECAAKNGGVPVGASRFTSETGIGVHLWRGKFWTKWSEAVSEAGFTPNSLTPAFSEELLLAKLAELTLALGREATDAELRLSKKKDPKFPGPEAFYRLGSKAQRTEMLRSFIAKRPEFTDVAPLLPSATPGAAESTAESEEVEGFVYMTKMGKHFKIGHTTAVPRRHREISLELPEAPSLVHVIRTDDPNGIEQYWHKRFEAFWTNGEWFALTPKEVRIFKKRKSM